MKLFSILLTSLSVLLAIPVLAEPNAPTTLFSSDLSEIELSLTKTGTNNYSLEGFEVGDSSFSYTMFKDSVVFDTFRSDNGSEESKLSQKLSVIMQADGKIFLLDSGNFLMQFETISNDNGFSVAELLQEIYLLKFRDNALEKNKGKELDNKLCSLVRASDLNCQKTDKGYQCKSKMLFSSTLILDKSSDCPEDYTPLL